PPSTLFPYTTLFRSLRIDARIFGKQIQQAHQVPCPHALHRQAQWRACQSELVAGTAEQQVGVLAIALPVWLAALTEPSRVGTGRSEEHTSELQSRSD